MNAIALIIAPILNIVVAELEQYKVVSPALGALISGIGSAATAAASDLTSSTGGISVTATSLLAAVSAAVQVLQTQTQLSPNTLAIIAALDSAVSAGLAATKITAVTPGSLAPVTPV